MDTQLKNRIDKMVQSDKVFLFMKGNPTFPQCGFSNQVVQILKAYGVEFGHFDVLSDMDVRQGIKDYSDWPTIPQLYVSGEFIGGCDIVREMWSSGELTELFQKSFPDKDIQPPKPPADPQDISPEQAAEMLKNNKEAAFYDVRSDEERAIAKVKGFAQLTQDVAQKILDKDDKEQPLVFMCHFGGRSRQACEFFAQKGFQNIYNVVGGIDAWSQSVDPKLARY